MERLLEHFRDVMSAQQPDRAGESMGGDSPPDSDFSQAVMAGFTVSPFSERVAVGNGTEDDQSKLIRLLDEVTQSICCDNETDQVDTSVAGVGSSVVPVGSSGGFVVEEACNPSLHGSSLAPPIYNPQARVSGSSFSYGSIPHTVKQPPPTFAEAIASSPSLSAVPMELSPLAAHYVPPMPAAQSDPILVRNEHGVFFLQPIAKPTPPYTPPSASSPMSPVPRYALPPAAQLPPHFLGVSLPQSGLPADTHTSKKTTPGLYASPQSSGSLIGGSHILSSSNGAGAYTYISTSVKSMAATGHTLPPPYPSWASE